MDVSYLVIGAGFGGLGAALTLAEAGADVLLCERLNYPGGCAGTFTRKGISFEAGATLFSGLDDEQLFGRWRRQHNMDFSVEWLNPSIRFLSSSGALDIGRQKSSSSNKSYKARRPAKRTFVNFFRRRVRWRTASGNSWNTPIKSPRLGLKAC